MNTAQSVFVLITLCAVGVIALAGILAAVRCHAAATAASAQSKAWEQALDDHLLWFYDRPDVVKILRNIYATGKGARLNEKPADPGPWTPSALRKVLRDGKQTGQQFDGSKLYRVSTDRHGRKTFEPATTRAQPDANPAA